MKCKNCGAVFSDDLDKCPYCGTMNKRGAYKKYRQKIRNIIDSLFGLKAEAYKSLSRLISASILRGLLTILLCIGLAFVVSRFINVNYYNDPKYDLETYEDILWEEDNLDRLDEALAKDDFDTIGDLYIQNARVVRQWSGYPTYCLRKKYQSILSRMDDHFSAYDLSDVLYFMYYPSYFSETKQLSQEAMIEYEEERQQILLKMQEKGYSEEELSDIYHKHADNYGYLTASQLDQYLKGDE
ncbi:MAG: hypothetical protein IKS69_05895 [Erysipelotrichaceae bacterium]|nr:hypothetical protein [Erysipelotrichaceae bacterium]